MNERVITCRHCQTPIDWVPSGYGRRRQFDRGTGDRHQCPIEPLARMTEPPAIPRQAAQDARERHSPPKQAPEPTKPARKTPVVY